MNNRMSVLSRRLGRFAACFSAITFGCLLFGLYAKANNQNQTVVLVSVLASVCFFAAFFLWVAHGFAWAMIPETFTDAKRAVESIAPEEPRIPAESIKPREAMRPLESMKPVESIKPIESMKPVETMKPIETMKPVEAKKPVEALKPAAVAKDAEEKVTTPKDPPDAKYTITGRRIL